MTFSDLNLNKFLLNALEEMGFSIPTPIQEKAFSTIMSSRDVVVRAHGDYRCWIISMETRDVPSRELWNCYQAIAQHLLAEWSSV